MVGEAYMIASMLQKVHIIKVIRSSLLLDKRFCVVARFRRLVAGFLSPRTGTDSRTIYLSVVVDKVARENSFSPSTSFLPGSTSFLPGQCHSISPASVTLITQS
jgi:hypothetical protein